MNIPQTNSIDSVATSLTTLMGAAAILADPNTEETEMGSDRIEADSSGNVILTSQAATIETQNPQLDMLPLGGTGDESGKQSVILEKWYHILDFEWHNSEQPYEVNKVMDFPHGLFPKDLDTEFVLSNYFEFMQYYQFVVELKLNVNFSPMSSGVAIVYYMPINAGDDKVSRTETNPMVYPHAVIHAKTTSEAKFCIPYNFEKRMYYDTMRVIGSINIETWLTLVAVAGTQSDVRFSLWFQLGDVRVSALGLSRQPFTTTRYAEVKRTFQRTLAASLSRNPTGDQAFFVDFLRNVMATGVESQVLDGLYEPLQRVIDDMEAEAGDGVTNFALTTIPTANPTEAGFPAHDLSFAGEKIPEDHSFVGHSPFKFETYMAIPGAIGEFTIHLADEPGMLVFETAVCPAVCLYQDETGYITYYDTPTSAVARHFMFWRGALKVTVQDAASKMHSVRYKMIFIPNQLVAPKDPDLARSAQTLTGDIGLQDTFSMVINFQSPTDWKVIPSMKQRNADVKCRDLAYSTGVFAIYLMTPLNSSGASADFVDFKVMMSYEGDFAFPAFNQIGYGDHPTFESEVGPVAASFEAMSTPIPPAQEFETASALPPTYMSNHADLKRLMARPVFVRNGTIDTNIAAKIAFTHMHKHLNSLCAYWRGRPTIHTMVRSHDATGAYMIGYLPNIGIGIEEFGNFNELSIGAYYCNTTMEKNCSVTLPYYVQQNFFTTWEEPAWMFMSPVNAKGEFDQFYCWGSDYEQYFPMAPPIVWWGKPSSEEDALVWKKIPCPPMLTGNRVSRFQSSMYNEEKEEFSTSRRRFQSQLPSVVVGSGYKKDLTDDGDVEANPGPVATEWSNEFAILACEYYDEYTSTLFGLACEGGSWYDLSDWVEFKVGEKVAAYEGMLAFVVENNLCEVMTGIHCILVLIIQCINEDRSYNDVLSDYSDAEDAERDQEDMTREQIAEELERERVRVVARDRDLAIRIRCSQEIHRICKGDIATLVAECRGEECYDRQQRVEELGLLHHKVQPREPRAALQEEQGYMKKVCREIGADQWLLQRLFRDAGDDALKNAVFLVTEDKPKVLCVIGDGPTWYSCYSGNDTWLQSPVDPNIKYITKDCAGGWRFCLMMLCGDVESNPGPGMMSKFEKECREIDTEEHLDDNPRDMRSCELGYMREYFHKYTHKKLTPEDTPLVLVNNIVQAFRFNHWEWFWEREGVDGWRGEVNIRMDPDQQTGWNISWHCAFEADLSAVGPNKRYVKERVLTAFLQEFNYYLINASEPLDSEAGFLDGLFSKIADKVTGAEPVTKLIEQASMITSVIDKVKDFVDTGVEQIQAILATLAKVILGLVNVYMNGSAQNVLFVIANFMLDIPTNPYLKKITGFMFEKLREYITKLFEYFAGMFRTRRGKPRVETFEMMERNREKSEDAESESEREPYSVDVDGGVHVTSKHESDEEEEQELDSHADFSFDGIVTAVFTIMTVGFLGIGSIVDSKTLGKTVGNILRGCKGLGSVGSGVRGIQSVITAIGTIVKGVCTYITGGVSDDERANVFFEKNKQMIADWVVDVGEFRRDYDVSRARVDLVQREVIRKLYDTGKVIHEGCLFAKDANTVFVKLSLCYKDVSDWNKNAVKGDRGVSSRPEPVVVFLFGEPGQGKSLLATRLADRMCKFFGADPGKGKHCMNPHSEYADNYAQQPVVVYDDIGQDPKGEDFKTFCQMVSTLPYYPVMAALEEKGAQFISPLIIATSNFKEPRPMSVNQHSAIARRMTFPIEVRSAVGEKLDFQAAVKDGSWQTGKCMMLSHYQVTGDKKGTLVSYEDIVKMTEDEVVRRAKLALVLATEDVKSGRAYETMMDSECGDCSQHGLWCFCHHCEALTAGVISKSEFDERKSIGIGDVDTGEKVMRADKYNWKIYSAMTDKQISDGLSLIRGTIINFLVEKKIPECIAYCREHGCVEEYFRCRRLLAETARREKVCDLLAVWKPFMGKVPMFLGIVAKVCGGVLLLISTFQLFAFISYLRSDRHDQKILAARGGNTYRRAHKASKWLGENVNSRFTPKHEMKEAREYVPLYMDEDSDVWSEGEEITYHDGCVLSGKPCQKTFKSRGTNEKLKKARKTEELAPQGAYNNVKPGKAAFAKVRRPAMRAQCAAESDYESHGGFMTFDTRDQIAQRIQQNVRAVNVIHENAERNGYGMATFLSDREVILPHHVLSKRGSDDIIELQFAFGESGVKSVPFDHKRVISIEDDDSGMIDFVMYYLESPISSIKKIPTSYFATEDELSSVELGGIDIITRRGYQPKIVEINSCKLVTEQKYQQDHFTLLVGIQYNVSKNHRGPGDSGAMVIGNGGKTRDKIVGMHVAGNERVGLALPLTYEFIHAARSSACRQYKGIIEAPEEVLLEQPLDSNCSLEVTGCNSYLGIVPHHPVSIMRQTTYERSPLYGVVEVLREPAPLSKTDPRVEPEYADDPVNNAPKKFANGQGYARPEHLREVVKDTSRVVTALIRPADSPRVLNEFETINGLPIDEAFQQVEMSSSSGWPFSQLRQGGKKPWFDQIGISGGENVFKYTKELRDIIERRERLAERRERISESYFTTFLKDELRPLKKIVQNKARTVECAPLDHLMLSRKYFGHFLNTVTKNPVDAFGCCVGINPEVDLSVYENYLREYSDSGMAEDFTLWDGSIKPQLITAAGKVIENYYRVGLLAQIEQEPQKKDELERVFEEAQNVRDVLLNEVAFTIHVSGYVLTSAITGLPSGHFFTSILNSLLHRLFNGLAWLEGTKDNIKLNSMTKFHENVRDLHYGDDGKDAVKLSAQKYYNRFTKERVAKRLGMTYTMEDKESKMVGISSLDECGFLKRKSVRHPKHRMIWNVPMEKRTIHSLINWKRKNAKLEDNISEAFREAYHHGEEYYDELFEVVTKQLDKLNLFISLPTFDWQDRSFLHRMGMGGNPFLKKKNTITSGQLLLAKIILCKEEDVVSTNPLVWTCYTEGHSHECSSCGRSVLGLTSMLRGLLCLACQGHDEPEGYARPGSGRPPSEAQVLMLKYENIEHHHIDEGTWCPSLQLGPCNGGPQLRHHHCRGCNRLALHLDYVEVEGKTRRMCAECAYGLVMPKSYFHNLCEICEPYMDHPFMRGRVIE